MKIKSSPVTFSALYEQYRRDIRVRRAKRTIAFACICAAALLLAIGFGTLIATAQSPLLCALGLLIMLCGIWGTYYLSTRH